MKSLFAVAESYPDLKGFTKLPAITERPNRH